MSPGCNRELFGGNHNLLAEIDHVLGVDLLKLMVLILPAFLVNNIYDHQFALKTSRTL